MNLILIDTHSELIGCNSKEEVVFQVMGIKTAKEITETNTDIISVYSVPGNKEYKTKNDIKNIVGKRWSRQEFIDNKLGLFGLLY